MPEEIDEEFFWECLVESDLKVQTEATIFAALEQVFQINKLENKIEKTSESPLFRMCHEKGETVQHITNMLILKASAA